jgi:hypothetical protein
MNSSFFSNSEKLSTPDDAIKCPPKKWQNNPFVWMSIDLDHVAASNVARIKP